MCYWKPVLRWFSVPHVPCCRRPSCRTEQENEQLLGLLESKSSWDPPQLLETPGLCQKKAHTWKYPLTRVIFKDSTYILSTCQHLCGKYEGIMKLCCQTRHKFVKKKQQQSPHSLLCRSCAQKYLPESQDKVPHVHHFWGVLTSCVTAEPHRTTQGFNLFLAFLHVYYCFFQLQSTFS